MAGIRIRVSGRGVNETLPSADAELRILYRLFGSVLRPLAGALGQLPPGGVLAFTTDDP